MKLNTIARTVAAVILSLAAVAIAVAPASAGEHHNGGPMPFTPPYVAPCDGR